MKLKYLIALFYFAPQQVANRTNNATKPISAALASTFVSIGSSMRMIQAAYQIPSDVNDVEWGNFVEMAHEIGNPYVEES